ncbi:hypothetical protein UNDYM_5057 [Undibacterium sp. YM2]|uniref:hypothetical protein n=1 Tax=Undibacterium sp. YM2 TaxID=2058625 RepID=UPI001331CB4D|nr:hypothetical protein [Undibacterium sp. YM2]BBB69310.1 hypothetical protein UNDYM_5057 [Undibacterium sp. YM2]
MSGSTIDLTEEDILDVLRRNGVDPEFVSPEQLDRIFEYVESEEDRVLSGVLYFEDPKQIQMYARVEIANILREKGILEIKPELAITVTGACLISTDIFERYNKIRAEVEKLEKFGNVAITINPGVDGDKSAHQISVDIHEVALENVNAASLITDALSEISKRAMLGGSFQVNFIEQREDTATHQRNIDSGIMPAKLEVIDFGYGSDGDEKFAERTYKDVEGDFFTLRREAGGYSQFSVIGPYQNASDKNNATVSTLNGDNWTKVEPELFELINQKLEQTATARSTPKM